jgi:hypothetical protein
MYRMKCQYITLWYISLLNSPDGPNFRCCVQQRRRAWLCETWRISASSIAFVSPPPPPPRLLYTNNSWSHTCIVQLILRSTQRNPPIPCGRVDAGVGHDEHRHNLQQLRVLTLRECPGTRENLGSVQRAEARGHVRCLALPLRGERGARVSRHVFDVVDEKEARQRGEREPVGIRRAVLALPGEDELGREDVLWPWDQHASRRWRVGRTPNAPCPLRERLRLFVLFRLGQPVLQERRCALDFLLELLRRVRGRQQGSVERRAAELVLLLPVRLLAPWALPARCQSMHYACHRDRSAHSRTDTYRTSTARSSGPASSQRPHRTRRTPSLQVARVADPLRSARQTSFQSVKWARGRDRSA